jgi:DNA-binding transcriptional MerR regulator
MNIGDVAERSGLPAKTIRYYEDIGLIRPKRGGNGYRAFANADVHKLAFLGRARSLGFSIEECAAGALRRRGPCQQRSEPWRS